jgi:hypothetical protein
MNGTVQFIDRNSGQATAMTINGASATSFNYAIAARSARRFTTSGSAAALTTGSIRITPADSNSTPSTFAVFSFQTGGNVISESGMAGAVASASMQAYVESTGSFSSGVPGSAESGIAIANTGTTAASVRLAFTYLNGTASTASTSLSIPPGGQTTAFLKQIPGFQNLPSPLQGIMTVSSTSLPVTANLVMALIRGQYNQLGNFIFSSTPLIPSAPLPVDTETIIPHFADGGGYDTSFIVIDNGPPANVLFRAESPSGQPLNLTLN